jgi:pyruvate ferredoxin oxidoreductase gamma subunit
MFQIRIHGRGGQGVVTAAELLAQAGFSEKKHAQAFPSFGSERTGAPVVAFCRISENSIRAREPISHPDALIVQDATLLRQIDVFAGLVPNGYVLINSKSTREELGISDGVISNSRTLIVPATEIAMEHLGKPVPNAVLLGAFSAFTEMISIESVVNSINEKFKPKVAQSNAKAAQEAFDYVKKMVAANA